MNKANKELLIYNNRKQDIMIWDISTPEKRAKGFLELFHHLKDDWEVYTCDYWGENTTEIKLQKQLYTEALKGNAQAAELLLMQRSDYEYEEFTIQELQ